MIFFTSFHAASLWKDSLCYCGSDSAEKQFLFYYQFPVVVLYCFSFISGFIKFNLLWNMPIAFIFWIMHLYCILNSVTLRWTCQMVTVHSVCRLVSLLANIWPCFVLIVAQIWQTGGNCPSASIPRSMWWTFWVWARSTFSIWTAITPVLSFPSLSLPTCSPVSHFPDQHCSKYSGQLSGIPQQQWWTVTE